VAVAAVICLLFGSNARSHGDLHLQIQAVTEAIAEAPNDPGLYFKRGELHRIHQLYDEALADFERVRGLQPKTPNLDLAFGRLYLEMNLPGASRTILDRVLESQPHQNEALVLRARALVLLDQPLAAAEDYARAIRHHTAPGPELFIERARVLAMAGAEHWDQALASLEDGMRMLGPLVTLQLPALDLELDAQRYDAALARLDGMAKRSPRKETWLKRRGEILLEARRTNDARAAFAQALDALDSLPPSRRQVPAMLDLERQLNDYLLQTAK
jgi:predicted Zn-dependent protease